MRSELLQWLARLSPRRFAAAQGHRASFHRSDGSHQRAGRRTGSTETAKRLAEAGQAAWRIVRTLKAGTSWLGACEAPARRTKRLLGTGRSVLRRTTLVIGVRQMAQSACPGLLSSSCMAQVTHMPRGQVRMSGCLNKSAQKLGFEWISLDFCGPATKRVYSRPAWPHSSRIASGTSGETIHRF